MYEISNMYLLNFLVVFWKNGILLRRYVRVIKHLMQKINVNMHTNMNENLLLYEILRWELNKKQYAKSFNTCFI